MDVSIDLTTDNLTDLVNQLIGGDYDESKKQMYNFYATLGGNKEVEFDHADLADFIMEHHISTEDILKIRYSPQSVFQVRSVSRCTDTLPGTTNIQSLFSLSYCSSLYISLFGQLKKNRIMILYINPSSNIQINHSIQCMHANDTIIYLQ